MQTKKDEDIMASEVTDLTPLDHNNFVPEKILNDNASSKCITVLGYMKSDRSEDGAGGDKSKMALVILNKTPFTEESAFGMLTSNKTQHDLELHNDVYRMFVSTSESEFNSTKTTLIYPATEKHIQKYARQDVVTFTETPRVYRDHVRPFIEGSQFSLEWVYNILDGKSEQERVLYRSGDACPDTDFLLLPDLKWSGLQQEDLYVMALVHRRDVCSLRDLTEVHLPLLKAILTKGKEVLEKKYNLPANKLRVYVHYQPSYYHLHVHFTHVRYEAPGFGADKAHLLDEIIDNIERNGSHYKECSLSYILKQETPLYNYLKDLNIIT